MYDMIWLIYFNDIRNKERSNTLHSSVCLLFFLFEKVFLWNRNREVLPRKCRKCNADTSIHIFLRADCEIFEIWWKRRLVLSLWKEKNSFSKSVGKRIIQNVQMISQIFQNSNVRLFALYSLSRAPNHCRFLSVCSSPPLLFFFDLLIWQGNKSSTATLERLPNPL